MAAGAHAGDQHIHALGEVGDDFGRRGALVHLDVGGVLELLRHPRIRRCGDEFGGAGDGALHAFFTRRQVETRAVGEHQAAALDRHAVGHHQHQLVAFYRRGHRQAHAGVARSGFDDGAAGLECAGFFRRLYHGKADTILDRAARIAALGLDPHFVRGAEQLVDADMRRAAYGIEYGIGLHRKLPGWVAKKNGYLAPVCPYPPPCRRA